MCVLCVNTTIRNRRRAHHSRALCAAASTSGDRSTSHRGRKLGSDPQRISAGIPFQWSLSLPFLFLPMSLALSLSLSFSPSLSCLSFSLFFFLFRSLEFQLGYRVGELPDASADSPRKFSVCVFKRERERKRVRERECV